MRVGHGYPCFHFQSEPAIGSVLTCETHGKIISRLGIYFSVVDNDTILFAKQ